MIEPLFAVPFYHINIGQYDVDHTRYPINRDAWNNEMPSTFTSNNQVLDHHASLRDAILDHTRIMVKLITNNTPELYFHSSWINRGDSKSFQFEHNHAGRDAFLSGVYYIDVPDGSGNIIFRNPISDFQYNKLWKTNGPSDRERMVTPKNGDLIIFPSFLYHRVTLNHSNDQRITLAFNVMEATDGSR